jgi:dTDP-4-dehydrorhamnose reductase
MKVLLTGASGQVGSATLASAPPGVQVRALSHSQLDLTDAAAIRAAVNDWQPDLIVNAAAYTAVDKAESESELAFAINAEGPRRLAMASQAIGGCRLIHLSTDYVFDGNSGEPYKPDAAVNPLSVYGRSKLAGEQAVVSALGERAIVLRTAWVYAPQGRNFVLTMLRLMRERSLVRVVADQHGTPTAAGSIAAAIWGLAQCAQPGGILHWTDAGAATWYDFAVAIAEEARAIGLISNPVELVPITTAEYPTAARRPRNSVLDTRDTTARLGMTPRHWRAELRDVLQRLQQS